MKRKVRKAVYQKFVLSGYDDDFPSTLFAGWVVVSKFKARHMAHARTLGRKLAKKLRWQVWKVRKERQAKKR